MSQIKCLLNVDNKKYLIFIELINRNYCKLNEFKNTLSTKYEFLINNFSIDDKAYRLEIYDQDFKEYVCVDDTTMIYNLSTLRLISNDNVNESDRLSVISLKGSAATSNIDDKSIKNENKNVNLVEENNTVQSSNEDTLSKDSYSTDRTEQIQSSLQLNNENDNDLDDDWGIVDDSIICNPLARLLMVEINDGNKLEWSEISTRINEQINSDYTDNDCENWYRYMAYQYLKFYKNYHEFTKDEIIEIWPFYSIFEATNLRNLHLYVSKTIVDQIISIKVNKQKIKETEDVLSDIIKYAINLQNVLKDNNDLGWEQISYRMRYRSIMPPPDINKYICLMKRKLNELYEKYLNVLKESQSMDDAQKWPYFQLFHNPDNINNLFNDSKRYDEILTDFNKRINISKTAKHFSNRPQTHSQSTSSFSSTCSTIDSRSSREDLYNDNYTNSITEDEIQNLNNHTKIISINNSELSLHTIPSDFQINSQASTIARILEDNKRDLINKYSYPHLKFPNEKVKMQLILLIIRHNKNFQDRDQTIWRYISNIISQNSSIRYNEERCKGQFLHMISQYLFALKKLCGLNADYATEIWHPFNYFHNDLMVEYHCPISFTKIETLKDEFNLNQPNNLHYIFNYLIRNQINFKRYKTGILTFIVDHLKEQNILKLKEKSKVINILRRKLNNIRSEYFKVLRESKSLDEANKWPFFDQFFYKLDLSIIYVNYDIIAIVKNDFINRIENC